jgi:PAS domain S-box-containing protein
MLTIADISLKTDVPILIADHQGMIVRVNECFTSTFGWAPEELKGKTLTVLIPKNMHDAHNLGFSRFLTTGKPKLLNQPLELKAVAKDGRELDVELVIVAEQQENQWVFAATIRPLVKCA